MGDDGDDASMRGGVCGVSDLKLEELCSRNTEELDIMWNNLEIRRRHIVFF
jgi:hypothetical protein